MKEKKSDKNIVKETAGDPAFYNDQIGNNKEPVKKNMKTPKDNKRSQHNLKLQYAFNTRAISL